MEASRARQDKNWGPAKLTIWRGLPFREAYLPSYLSQEHKGAQSRILRARRNLFGRKLAEL
jgi:hypothetical protein